MNFIRKMLLIANFAVGIGVISALAMLEVDRVVLMIVATVFITEMVLIATIIDKENKSKK